LPRVLDQIRRAALEIPVVVMTYFEPAHGLRARALSVREAAAAGVSGLLLTDFPPAPIPNSKRWCRQARSR